MTKRKKIYSTLMATCMVIAFSGIAFAEESSQGADMAGDPTVYEEPAQIDRVAMIEELVAQWGSDDITAYQLSGMLEKANDSKLLEVWQAESLDEINTILRGTTDLDGPLVLGDTDMDYTFTPVTPCRIVDTRNAGGIMTAGSTREFFAYGPGSDMTPQGGNAAGCDSPVGEPRGVMINVTAVPSGNGNLRAYAANVSTPTTSLVNYKSGVNIANAAAVKTYFSGGPKELEIYSSANSHVIIDVMGYYDVPTIPAGVEYAGGQQILAVGTADIVARSISVNVPTSSHCVITASGFFALQQSSYGRCSITTGTTHDQSNLILTNNYGVTSMNHVNFSGTRGFSQSAGTTTYRLACDSSSDSGISINDTQMTAACTKNKY